MAKPKKVVVVEEDDEVKAEGLEIISIGSLYNGSWEKKYWSSSRGKDRYPYPVGYHAVRAQNGSTCKIEIHDGPKGPLFMITSADGHSCSGQTPDMVWEKFQKKHYPRMKTWHGKRLSCRIDGVEFFGFKNSFVQRLLRELVANVNGTTEKRLLSSSFCNEVSITKHDNQHPDRTYSDLQAHLEKPKITKKRGRKNEITNMKPVDRNGPKKPRSQGLTCNTEVSNSHENQRNHKQMSPIPPPSTEQENDFHEHQGALQASVCLKSKTVEEKDVNYPAKDSFPVEVAQEESKFAGSENCKSIKIVNNVAEVGKPPNRSKNFSFLGVAKDEAGGAPVPRDSPGVENVDLCAPDTLDFVEVNADNTSHSSPTIQDKSTHSLKEDSATANNVISEGMMTDPYLEVEIGTSTSNASSEKSELDSLGQEITKAMMTVLLPQAIPLLNKVSRKKKVPIGRAFETLSCGVDPKEENKKASYSMEASFPAAMLIKKTKGEMDEETRNQSRNLSTVVPSFEDAKSVIPDSYEDDLCVDYTTKQVSSNMVGADQSSVEKDTNLTNVRKQLVVIDVMNVSSVCHVETSKSKHTLCHDDVHLTSDKKLQEDNVCICESILSCMSSSKKVLSEKVEDVCANLEKNSTGIRVHLLEKDLKALDCTEDRNDANQRDVSNCVKLSWKDNPAKTAAAETSSSAQIPNNVYSRKVSKLVPSAEKFNGPLSESIICRNFGDNFVPKTHCDVETLLPSKCSQMSSDDKLHKDFCDAEARIGRQSHDLPDISQKSTVFCDSGGKEVYNSYDPSILHVKKSEACSDKLVGQMNLVELSHSVLSQKQKESICEYNTSNAKKDKASSDLKLQEQMELSNELEGIVDIVGCYIHPLPISSVKLSTIGNEIYICVSCGLLVDKNRTLFIYKLTIQESRVGCPSFVGNTSVILPFPKDDFGREIALESSCLLFTPDGQSLVLLDSMRTPYCREGRVDCLCSTCASNRFEENAVKIVQVKPGYVSLVAKLKTVDSVQCILVCEPNHLVAVGDSGRLHLWEMNSTWSAHMEEFVIPINDLIYPSIVELKRIHKCAPLVVGHNGFGEFGVWDISRRVFLSRFSAPSTSTYQFFPICAFGWQRNRSVFMDADMEDNINGIMDTTKRLFLERNENNSFLPSEGEDIAIWLLVQTVSDSDAQSDYTSSDCQLTPVRLWRLALLVKNMVILGSPLDLGDAVINASAGHGIIGTHDGLVFMWDLFTGTKLGTLHDFKGGAVSCIATDDSRPRVLAVAGGGQLLVYLHGQNNTADQLGGVR